MSYYGSSVKFGQNSVQPIRDLDDLNNAINYWKKKRNAAVKPDDRYRYDRNYMLFLLGINVALRVSDLRVRKVEDVKKEIIVTREKKTGKIQQIPLNGYILEELRAYINRNGLTDSDYLFRSRNGLNKPLQRCMIYQILQEIKEGCRLKYPVGTHTMRKTFGYHYYKQTNNVVALQRMLNHSRPDITLVYIGMVQAEVDQERKSFCLR